MRTESSLEFEPGCVEECSYSVKHTYTFSYMYVLLIRNLMIVSESQRARSNWEIRNREESSQTLDGM